MTVEHGNETEQTTEKTELVNLIPIGSDCVARSYSGCSGRKFGAFREYITACNLNSACEIKGKAG